MATPEIVLGASLLTLFVAIGAPPFFPLSGVTILIAHIMFNISFVVVTVRARLAGFPTHLEEAAMDLGANEMTTFRKVTFPLILPGIMAAALLAFSLSIDDFVITNFTAGGTVTFPMFIYAKARIGIPPQVNVIGTIIFLTAVGLVALSTIISRRRSDARRGAGQAATARPGARMTATTDPPTAALPDHAVVPAVWGRITNLDVDRGEGSWLITRDGERYLDYSSGIGVTNTGHAHPRVAAAIAAQAAKLLHGQQNILYHEPGLRLYERLRHVLPGGPWQAFLSNSGAEAVEAAVKLARVATGRPVILAFRGGYPRPDGPDDGPHDGQGRLPGGIRAAAGLRLPHAVPVLLSGRRRAARARSACTCDWEAQLDLTVPPAHLPATRSRRSSSSRSSARAATSCRRRRSCRASARSPGSTASCSSPTRSRPASGGPARCSPSSTGTSSRTSWSWPRASRRACRCSGILARPEIWTAGSPGPTAARTAATWSSCAAANATLDVIEDEGLVANARERGAQLLAGLRELQADHPAIGDVRGLGLHGRDGVRQAGRR